MDLRTMTDDELFAEQRQIAAEIKALEAKAVSLQFEKRRRVRERLVQHQAHTINR